MIMKKCKICGEKTEVVFNLNLKAVPICEDCANAIVLQQIPDLVRQRKNIK